MRLSKLAGGYAEKERIEAAKELRYVSRDCLDGGGLLPTLKRVLGVDGSWRQVLARLADLIEPAPIGEDTSDGYHTFGQLYYQRMMLWACIVNANPGIAWKTRLHEDGGFCFGGGWFLVAIDTPAGQYGYHYEDTPENWALFRCEEIPRAKPWDGYTEADVTRLASLAEANVRTKPIMPVYSDGEPIMPGDIVRHPDMHDPRMVTEVVLGLHGAFVRCMCGFETMRHDLFRRADADTPASLADEIDNG